MATDKKFSQLPPVVVPQPTDQFGCNQAGVSKRQNRLQLHTLQSGEHLLLPSVNEPATPTLQIGSNSGFFEEANNILGVSIDGVSRFSWTTGQFRGNNTNAGAIVNENATLVNPTLIPNRAILTSGIGGDSFGRTALISNGITGVDYLGASGAILQTNQTDVGLTAGTTQTQAGGLQLLSSLNEIAIVANVDDTVVAPLVGPGVRLLVINNGANRLQLFPAVGDDIGAGVDTAVTIEAGEIGEFIGQTAVVWDTLFSGAASGGVPDPLIIPTGGSAAAPKFAFGDGDTGFFEPIDDNLQLSLVGTARFFWELDSYNAVAGTGPAMKNAAAGATVVGFAPRRSDGDTGIGSAGGDLLSLIAGGVEIARATEAVGANQFAIVSSGGTTVPELTSLADLDTGFRWAGTNQLVFIGGGVQAWNWTTAQFFSSFSDGPAMVNGVGDITLAGFLPQQADTDTGLGGDGFDSVSLVAGGIAGLRLKELNSGVVQAPVADVAITAFATGGQASAVALKQSYNVLATVATTGDSVKLPATFNVNSLIYIKNDGANSADVFPATGDDLGAGLNTAVAVAAGESVTFIATAFNATWTQLIKPPAAALSFPILADDGTAGAPSYSFTGAPTSGLFRNGANQLEMSIAGTSQWAWFNGFFLGKVSGSPLMQNFAASATTPTFLPSNSDLNTGIGSAGGDILSLIAGGKQIAQCKEVPGAEQFIVSPGFIENNAALPSLAFGDGDSGWYENADDTISLSIAGVRRFAFGAAVIQGVGVARAGALRNETASDTNPTLNPDGADSSTGIGSVATASLSLIATGVEGLRLTHFTSGVLQAPAADIAITAFATGGQASAVTLKQSYNIISVCATTGDSVKLPSVFAVNTIIYIKNDGAASCDVFPFSGDDLGAGVNVAIAVVAGASAVFIATAANATWTQLVKPVGAGAAAADPSLLGDGSAGAPSYSFSASPTTGIFSSASNVMKIAVAGVANFVISANSFAGELTGAPKLVNEVSSNTNPTLLPHNSAPNSGLGGISGQPSLISNGKSGMSVNESGGAARIGFYDASPIAKQTGVAVTTSAVHAALVSLGLISA